MAIALWAGLGLGRTAGPATAAALLLAGVALGLLAWRAPPRTGALLVFVMALLLGAARGAAHQGRLDAAREALPGDDALVRAAGIVDEPARRESGVPVVIARVLVASPSLPRRTRVRLRLPEGCAADWGDTLEVLARIERFVTQRNPGGFDARRAADAAGVIAHGRAFAVVVRPARGVAVAPVAAALRLRRAMEAALARELSPGARELASPLLFGDRSAMTPELDARLRGSGLVHLLALSGLHVAWLAAVARGLAALAGRGLAARACAGAACAVGYAMLAGPLPSLMRAVAGELAKAGATLVQRALDPVQSLALAAIAILGWQPGWADDLGFQLSCFATLGLVTLSGPLASPWSRWPRVQALVQPVTTTLAAQVTAVPLLIAKFHALPWTGVAANLVAVPLSELLLAAAWLGGLADALAPGAGRMWLHACEPLALGLRLVADRASSPALALLPCGGDPAPAWLAAAGAGLLAIALPLPRTVDARPFGRSRRRALVAAGGLLVLACALLAALVASPLRPPPGRWWLVGIDVGQGDALALAFGDAWWLVDTGPRSPTWDAGEGAVLPFLRWAGVRRLERLILTHDDGDHTGGAPAVRRSLPVRETDAPRSRPGVPGPAWRFHADTLARGDTLRRSPPAFVLWPPRAGEPGDAVSRRGDNAAALVLEVGGAGGRALLTADADSLVEAALAVAPGLTLLKAGHHGSGSSSGAAFAAAVRPRRVLLSVGRHNAYGHPSAGALARLLASGAILDRTDRDGAIWYEFSDAGVERIDWRTARPWSACRAAWVPAQGPRR